MVGKGRDELRMQLNRPCSLPNRETAIGAVVGTEQQLGPFGESSHLVLVTADEGDGGVFITALPHPRSVSDDCNVAHTNPQP